MKIDQVRATAFGPFRDGVLNLAPGMNVVHGPNEAGKSSWFAATYAGLAGQRKPRGIGAAAQSDFATRHKPWSGTRWRAGTTLTLDSGQVLRVDHDLRSGESQLVDDKTGQPMAVYQLEQSRGRELVTDSTLDGTRLLGLNRSSARSTVFIGQADILRVLADAGELQELIERAAASDETDMTADEALDWLSERRDRLIDDRRLEEQLAIARAKRRHQIEQRGQLNSLLGDVRKVRDDVTRSRRDRDLMLDIDRWTEINQLRSRLAPARTLAERIALQSRGSRVDEDRIKRATLLIGGYDALGHPPALPEGPSADQLEAEIESLPTPTPGDIEPRKSIVSAHERLVAADAALESHQGFSPEQPLDLNTALSPEELRAHADTLAAPPPHIDEDLEADTLQLRRIAEAAEASYDALVGKRVRAEARNAELTATYEAAQAKYAKDLADYETLVGSDAPATVASRGLTDSVGQDPAPAQRSGLGWLMILGFALIVGATVCLAIGQTPIAIGLGAVGLAAMVAGFLRGGSGDAAKSSEGRGFFDQTDDELTTPPKAEDPSSATDQDDSADDSASTDEVDVVSTSSTSEGDANSEKDEGDEAEVQSPSKPALERPVEPIPPVFTELKSVGQPPERSPRLMALEDSLAQQETEIKDYRERIDNAREQLSSLDLPTEPEPLRELADRVEKNRDKVALVERHEAQVGELVEQRQEARTKLALLLDVAESAQVDDAFDAYVDACRQRAMDTQAAARRADLQNAFSHRVQLELAHRAANADRIAKSQELLDFAGTLGNGDPHRPLDPGSAVAQVRGWLATQERDRAAYSVHSDLTARLDQILDGTPLAAWEKRLSQLVAEAGPEPSAAPVDVRAFRDDSNRAHDVNLAKWHDLKGQLQQLTSSLGSLAEAAEAEATADHRLQSASRVARCIDAAKAELSFAKERAHANIAPEVEERLRPWLPRITEGRYVDATVSPDDLQIRVKAESGESRQAHLLSQGTTEQIFLLLRVALAEVLAGDVAESAPIVLDDVTVQSDRARTLAILDWLHELSAEHQVVVFTQELDVVKWANQKLTSDRDRVTELTRVT